MLAKEGLRASAKEILVLTRPQNGIIVSLSFVSGWLWASPVYLTQTHFWIGVLFVYLLHAAGTIQNDIVDQNADYINTPNRPLVSGSISILQARLFWIALLVLALSFAVVGGKTFLLWGILIYGVGWLYNEPPYLGSHRPMVSIILLGFYFSLIPWLFGFFVAQGLIGINLILAVAGASLCRAATSLYKDFKDIEGDRRTGKKTFLIHFGPRVTLFYSFTAYVLGALLLIYSAVLAQKINIIFLLFIPFLFYGVLLRWWGMSRKTSGLKLFPRIFTNEIRIQLAYIILLVWK